LKMSKTGLVTTNSFVFVQHDGSTAHYEMDEQSPVRIIPPYGTAVEVLATTDEWVKIKAFNKAAWMKKHHICNQPPPSRFDFSPYVFAAEVIAPHDTVPKQNVEFGPKGGRFVRTKSGYRRYF
jgi:hypothetical protein